MTNFPSRNRWTRRLGVLVGVAAALLMLHEWRVPSGAGALGADVTVTAGSTGPLGVRPEGSVLSAIALKPGPHGGTAHGTVSIRNQTGQRLAVRLRAKSSIPDLDGLLRLRIVDGDATVFAATLGELSRWTERRIRLRVRERRELAVSAWLPASVRSGWRGRIDEVALQFKSVAVGA